MNISRKKFIILFIVSGFVFMFITTTLLGSTCPRGFPKHPDSFLGTASPIVWKNTASTIILPIKIVLIGPLLLSTDFLRDDSPPPFIGIYLIFYWTILASIIYYLVGKIKHSQSFGGLHSLLKSWCPTLSAYRQIGYTLKYEKWINHYRHCGRVICWEHLVV